MKDTINKARRLIKEADALLIVAGAGMGVDSGLPDYHGRLIKCDKVELYFYFVRASGWDYNYIKYSFRS